VLSCGYDARQPMHLHAVDLGKHMVSEFALCYTISYQRRGHTYYYTTTIHRSIPKFLRYNVVVKLETWWSDGFEHAGTSPAHISNDVPEPTSAPQQSPQKSRGDGRAKLRLVVSSASSVSTTRSTTRTSAESRCLTLAIDKSKIGIVPVTDQFRVAHITRDHKPTNLHKE